MTASTLPFYEAVLSGRSAGVPGAVAMLALAQKEHGRLAWAPLFGDAERLADERLHRQPAAGRSWQRAARRRPRRPTSSPISPSADGTTVKAGDRLRNPAYAATLRRIAAEGPAALLTRHDRQRHRRAAAASRRCLEP